MNIIQSRQNAEIKAVASLHDAKQRKIEQKFIAEGVRTVTTLMQRLKPLHLYMTQEIYDKRVIKANPDIITIVTPEVMDKISTTKTPSGVVAVFNIPPQPTSLSKGLVLTHITDPGNMGTLIRTAAAMASKTVVIIEGVDPWHPKVIQATAGTIAFVDIFEISWTMLNKMKGTLTLCALVVKDGQTTEILKRNDILIVIGNESTGIPANMLADCPLRCTLPMRGNIESLNAAIAGSIALYLAFEQK